MQSLWLLWAQTHDASVYLQKRPTPGVWAGLYCFPLFEDRDALQQVVPKRYHAALQYTAAFKHVLTHKDSHLHPVRVELPAAALGKLAGLAELVSAKPEGAWFAADRWPQLGLPAPIKKLLLQ